MDKFMNNWIVVAILLPVLITQFKSEIGRLFTAWNIYRLRAFDADGNPATSDRVQIKDPGTGVWENAIIEKYVFSMSTKKRGVYLIHPDGAKEKVGFLDWAKFRKRMPPLDSRISKKH